MPSGLTNAHTTFQWELNVILFWLKWKTGLVYLVNATALSKSAEGHLRHDAEVLRIVEGALVSLKLSKCKFFCATVTLFAHVVKPGKLETKNCAMRSLKQVVPPHNKREIRSFLRLHDVYRRLVQNFAHIESSLNNMLPKESPETLDKLSDKHLRSFRKLIKSFTSALIMHFPQPHQPCSIDTDALDRRIGCELFQAIAKNIRCSAENNS